ncbi:hypothetical protein H7F33_05145 [Pedobacter sp. PAMC26386]|nr:hypothetical protein H7F33_05145 [Pedobacter sp. PAMC26386]
MKCKKTFLYLMLLLIYLPFSGWAGNIEKYQQGYYLDSVQHKIEGLIAFDGSSCQYFFFKKKLGDKETKVNVAQCSRFDIGEHVFERIDHIDFVTMVRKRPIDSAFAELLENGTVKLYKISLELSKMDGAHKMSSTAAQLSGTDGGGLSGYLTKTRVYYYMKRDNETKYTRVESRKSKFKPQMEAYLKDKADVIAQLKNNKDYSYNNLELILKDYNK